MPFGKGNLIEFYSSFVSLFISSILVFDCFIASISQILMVPSSPPVAIKSLSWLLKVARARTFLPEWPLSVSNGLSSELSQILQVESSDTEAIISLVSLTAQILDLCP